MADMDRQARGGKGVHCVTLQKNGANGTKLVSAFNVKEPFDFVIVQKDGTASTINTELPRIEMRAGKGQMYVFATADNPVVSVRLPE